MYKEVRVPREAGMPGAADVQGGTGYVGWAERSEAQHRHHPAPTRWAALRLAHPTKLHFLPVKIQHEENGGVFTAYLDSVEGLKLAQEPTQTATSGP